MKLVAFLVKEPQPFLSGSLQIFPRQRVKRIVAKMKASGVTTTTARNNEVLPLALFDGSSYDERPIHCDRGHLIALEFGGPEASDNLVPMYGGFNSGGRWRQLEQQELPAYANQKAQQGVEDLEVEIVCDYSADPEDDPRIPTAFTVSAKPEGAQDAEIVWTIPHPKPVPVIADVDVVLLNLYTQARNRMNLAGWLIEDHLPDMSDWPTYRRKPVFTAVANRNASHAERPYGFLDFLEWEQVSTDPKSLETWQARIILSATSDFTAPQIEAIRNANRVFNGGLMRSDNLGDFAYSTLKYRLVGFPKGTLLTGSRDLAPEVDHIIPQSMTGCATYSNAQLISGVYNNSKRAQITAAQQTQLKMKRGTGRVRQMTGAKAEARDVLMAELKKRVGPTNTALLKSRLDMHPDDLLEAVSTLSQSLTYGTNPRALKKVTDALLAKLGF